MAEKKKTEEQELNEIFDNKRFFIHSGPDGDGQKYYLDSAGVDDVRSADWHYSKTYNEALLAGVATAAQMADILEERQITGKDFEAKRLKLIEALDEAEKELETVSSVDEKKILADKVEDLRNQLFRHNQRASSPMSNVVEQLAEDARIEYLTSAMIKNDKGEKVWEDYADYKTTENISLAMRARYEVMLYFQGLSSDFLEQTPEARARVWIEEQGRKQLDSEPEAETKSTIKTKKK